MCIYASVVRHRICHENILNEAIIKACAARPHPCTNIQCWKEHFRASISKRHGWATTKKKCRLKCSRRKPVCLSKRSLRIWPLSNQPNAKTIHHSQPNDHHNPLCALSSHSNKIKIKPEHLKLSIRVFAHFKYTEYGWETENFTLIAFSFVLTIRDSEW